MSWIELGPELRIRALRTGYVAVRPSQVEGRGHGLRRRARPLIERAWTPALPILAWVVDHPEGLIVVDAGETAATAQPGYLPARHPYYRRAVRFDVRPEDEIGPLMRGAGLDPAAARWLVLTHLHTDHAGGLAHFPDVPTLVDGRELAAASGRRGRLAGYLPHRWPSGFRPIPVEWRAEAVGPFRQTFSITAAGDVVLLPTPGHTPGHLSVLVRGRDRQVLLVGDAAYTEALLLARTVDGVAVDERASRRSADALIAVATKRPTAILPTHDPAGVDRLVALATATPDHGRLITPTTTP